jgi:hypothetical protein
LLANGFASRQENNSQKQQQHTARVGSQLGLSDKCDQGLVASDPEAQSRVAALENSLRELGWVKGHKDKAKIIANLTMICAALMILPTVSS